MRTVRVLSLIVGGLAAVIGLTLLAVWLLVDPNAYKPRIVAAVKQATGRDLVLQGDIKLTVLPWIALKLGPASLGNPPGFAGPPFVSFQHAAVRAKVWPLLAGRLEIGQLALDGLDLRLARDAQGRGNWQGFGKTDAPGAAAADGAGVPPAVVAPATAEQSDGMVLQGIAGIHISGARVSYQAYTLEKLSLETGAFAEHGLVPVTLRFDAGRGFATEHASVDARFDFVGDPGAKRYGLEALNVNGTVNLAHDERPVRWEFVAPKLDTDLAAQTLGLPEFVLTVAGARLSGSARGTHIVDAPEATGSLTLAPLVVREVLPRFGLTAPKTRDERALASLAASSAFVYAGNAVRLNEVAITLDDTHVKGSVAITDLKTRSLQFALSVDGIDLDRYLAPQGALASVPRAAVPAEGAAGSEAGGAAPLDAHGTLTVGSVHFAPLDLTQLKVTVAARDGVVHLYPLEAQIDGGEYAGNVTLDRRGSVPKLSMDEHLTGVDVAQLARSAGKEARLTGRGNMNLKAAGRGPTTDALLASLDGHFDAYVTQGALDGVDLGFELGRAEALLKRQDTPAAPNTHRTAFDTLKVSAAIANGVARTQDFTLSSAVLKVTGQGSVALPTQALDLALLVDTLRAVGGVPLQIPIRVAGTVQSPTVRPDLDALLKGQFKQKAQDFLQDKLKGLFNR